MQTFAVNMGPDDFVEAVFYAQLERDPILIYQFGDGETGWGTAVRFRQRTLKAKWTAHIPRFNIGPGLLEGAHAYLTAAGFVAKLDLGTGRYVWRHTNLYSVDYSFGAFEVPSVDADRVFFTGRSFSTDPRPAKSVQVNKRSGRIIDIK